LPVKARAPEHFVLIHSVVASMIDAKLNGFWTNTLNRAGA
jgi:hypothetical protein